MGKSKRKPTGKRAGSRSRRDAIDIGQLHGYVGCEMTELVVDQEIGPEKLLVILDESRIIDRLGHAENAGFFLNSGVGRTQHGPVQSSTFNVKSSTFNVKSSTFNVQFSRFKARSVFNFEPLTLNS